jgi:hypothetical protein
MAFFAGTGPEGKTCGDCKLRGYYRQSLRTSYNKKTGKPEHKSYRVQKCAAFKLMTGRHGATVKAEYPSCKYFEPRPKVQS